jgi:hypothetical protein
MFTIIFSLIITKLLFNFNSDDNYFGFIFLIITIGVYAIVCCSLDNRMSVFGLLDRMPIAINTYNNILKEKNKFTDKYNENIKNINNYLNL